MRKWSQESLVPRHTGTTVKAQITFPEEADYILVTTRRYGLPNHHELGETFDRFNRTVPGLLRAIEAVIEAVVDVREIHGIRHGILEVSEIVDLPDHDPHDPF